MSKGTPMRQLRISDDDWQVILRVVEHRNENSREKPWTMSDFFRIAAMEKVTKMARSRGRHLEVGDEYVNLPLEATDDFRTPGLFDTVETNGANS